MDEVVLPAAVVLLVPEDDAVTLDVFLLVELLVPIPLRPDVVSLLPVTFSLVV